MKKLPASTSSEFIQDHVICNTYKLLSVSVVIHYFKLCGFALQKSWL